MKTSILLVFVSLSSFGQMLDYKKLSKKYGTQHLSTLEQFLSIPCDANHQTDIYKNIGWVSEAFSARNFSKKVIETATIPVLLFEKKSLRNKAPTILFYFHSDGQPVKNHEWNQTDPYKATLKHMVGGIWEELPYSNLFENEIDPDWRIFARASSDDKGPIVMFLAALDALLASNQSPNYNLKVLVDFEEEKGSPNLSEIILPNKEAFASDLLLIFDGPSHPSILPTITYGARGIVILTLTTYGPASPLHSGHYGNYAPNPALRMAQLLGSMKDESGRTIIKGFNDGIIMTEQLREQLAQIPDDPKKMNVRIGINSPVKIGDTYQESLMFPSLNIRGLKSAEVGKMAATIVPSEAIAEIDIRTVKSTPAQKLIEDVKKHIASQGYYLVNKDPNEQERSMYDKICKFESRPSYEAFSTPLDSPKSKWLINALTKVHGQKPLMLPIMGGSVPISPFVTKLKVDAVIVPTVNADNNQHAANENLRLGNYFDGIKTFMGLLTTPF